MRQQVTSLSAVGNSLWLPVDNRRFSTEFQLGIRVALSDTPTLTYNIDATKDLFGQENYQLVTLSRTTITATGTIANHGFETGDNIIVFDTNYTNHDPEPNFEGSYDITVTGANTFTYTVANTGQTTSIGRLIRFNVDKTIATTQTASASFNVTEPVSAVRLRISAHTTGTATMTLLQQG